MHSNPLSHVTIRSESSPVPTTTLVLIEGKGCHLYFSFFTLKSLVHLKAFLGISVTLHLPLFPRWLPGCSDGLLKGPLSALRTERVHFAHGVSTWWGPPPGLCSVCVPACAQHAGLIPEISELAVLPLGSAFWLFLLVYVFSINFRISLSPFR